VIADRYRQHHTIIQARREGDSWGPPYPLPGQVNDESNEYNPTVALDGSLELLRNQTYEDLVRLLGGPQNGDGTIYWISASIMEALQGN
jgi:hypothetical protein